MTHLPTMSQLPRWFACQLSDVLPRAEESGEAAAAGVERHYFFENVSRLMRDPKAIHIMNVKDPESGKDLGEQFRAATLEEARELALVDVKPEYRDVLKAISLEALGLDETAAEVALAYDLETGEAREIGRGLAREYGEVKPTEIVGTLDRLALLGEEGVYVGDFKGRAHRQAPEKDEQFLAGALAAARLLGRRWARIEVIRVIDEAMFPSAARVELVELDRFELRLQARAELARVNVSTFKETGALPAGAVGSWCTYCPHARFCPAQWSIARAALGETDEEIRGVVATGQAYLDEHSAPRIHALVGRAEKILEKVKAALREYGRATPFQLEDGRWYGVPPDSTSRSLGDGQAVERVLVELFGEEAARAAVKVEATFDGVESAARKYLTEKPGGMKRGELKVERERAEELLAKRGLLRVTSGGLVKVHTRKEKATP